MFLFEFVEAVLDLFRNAFLNIPIEGNLSILYVILNFLLQIFAVFSGGFGGVGF